MDYYRAYVLDKDGSTVRYLEENGWFCGSSVAELKPVALYMRKDGELEPFTMIDEKGEFFEEKPPELFQICFRQVD